MMATTVVIIAPAAVTLWPVAMARAMPPTSAIITEAHGLDVHAARHINHAGWWLVHHHRSRHVHHPLWVTVPVGAVMVVGNCSIDVAQALDGNIDVDRPVHT